MKQYRMDGRKKIIRKETQQKEELEQQRQGAVDAELKLQKAETKRQKGFWEKERIRKD